MGSPQGRAGAACGSRMPRRAAHPDSWEKTASCWCCPRLPPVTGFLGTSFPALLLSGCSFLQKVSALPARIDVPPALADSQDSQASLAPGEQLLGLPCRGSAGEEWAASRPLWALVSCPGKHTGHVHKETRPPGRAFGRLVPASSSFSPAHLT